MVVGEGDGMAVVVGVLGIGGVWLEVGMGLVGSEVLELGWRWRCEKGVEVEGVGVGEGCRGEDGS